MATNKERTSSAAMRKLLLQSASKKEQEIQQIGSVAESTIPQPAIEHPIHEVVPPLQGDGRRAHAADHRQHHAGGRPQPRHHPPRTGGRI